MTDKALHTTHKLVYLANEYPGKTIRELGSEMFALSALDMNAAVWHAQDEGLLFVDQKTGYYKVEMVPEKWQLGPDVEELAETILYVFNKLAENETDLDDYSLATWGAGNVSHDFACATKLLINQKKIASYDVTTLNEEELSKKAKGKGKKAQVVGESTYTFYSLWDNAEQQWGRKQFTDKTKLK